MTLTTLLIYIAIAALVLSAIVIYGFKKDKSWLMTYVQNFCGALFVFSGYVKAVDPLGTAYKMQDYFAEFHTLFADTWMSFLAPLFPWLSSIAVAFSVIMIIFEIVLGLALIIGAKPKFSSWAFFLLVGFFTILTGFTYLTGYVPQGVHFFEFGSWGEYVKSNMKVTDCGCFGDFIKLEPKTSFLKDVFLLIPAFFMIWRHKDLHQIFDVKVRTGILGITTAGLIWYCLSNFLWNIPGQDFRPFKVTTDVATKKVEEAEIQAAVKVVAYKLTNKSSGEVVELPYADFLKQFKNYPKAEWEYEQVKTEPASEPTKISDYVISDNEGNDITDSLLNYNGYSLMMVSYKLKGTGKNKSVTRKVPQYAQDTVVTADGETSVVQRLIGETEETVDQTVYTWDDRFSKSYSAIVNPFAAKAEEAGLLVYGVAGGASSSKIDDFRHATQAAFPIYQADDILLKTIVRSNPGIVLWKDGKIIMKWHYKQLPSWEEVQAAYVK